MSLPPTRLVRTSALLVPLGALGVALGLGLRAGETWRVPRIVGRLLLERAGVPSATLQLTATLIGTAQQLLLAAAWGVLLGLVLRAMSGRGGLPWLGGILGGVAAAMLNLLAPPLLRLGYPLVDGVARAVPLAFAVALALIGAAWVARTPPSAVARP